MLYKVYKKMSVILLSFLLLLFFTVAASASEIRIIVNGETLKTDVPPIQKDGRILVPMRAIFEKLGAYVKYDETTNTIGATKGKTAIAFTPGRNIVMVNDEVKTIDVAPIIIDGRTLIPIRFTAEALGAYVNWEENINTVIISSKTPLPNWMNPTSQEVSEYINYGKQLAVAGKIPDFSHKEPWTVHTNNPKDEFLSNNQTTATLSTPYESLVNLGWLYGRKYQDPPSDSIQGNLYQTTNFLNFTLDVYGNKLDFHKNFHAVLKQGDKVIQPIEKHGLKNFAEMTNSWPKSPAYRTTIAFSFPYDGVDFNNNIELALVTDIGEFDFQFDLSKMR